MDLLNQQPCSLKEIRISLERESNRVDQRYLVSLPHKIGITRDDSITGLLEASLGILITP